MSTKKTNSQVNVPMTASVIRSDIKPPKGLNLDQPHFEGIDGVVIFTLSEYSLTVHVQGAIPDPEDMIAALVALRSQSEYSDAFASQTAMAE